MKHNIYTERRKKEKKMAGRYRGGDRGGKGELDDHFKLVINKQRPNKNE